MGYKTCPYCGAHLDPGETCDCQKETAQSDQGEGNSSEQSKKEEKQDE